MSTDNNFQGKHSFIKTQDGLYIAFPLMPGYDSNLEETYGSAKFIEDDGVKRLLLSSEDAKRLEEAFRLNVIASGGDLERDNDYQIIRAGVDDFVRSLKKAIKTSLRYDAFLGWSDDVTAAKFRLRPEFQEEGEEAETLSYEDLTELINGTLAVMDTYNVEDPEIRTLMEPFLDAKNAKIEAMFRDIVRPDDESDPPPPREDFRPDGFD